MGVRMVSQRKLQTEDPQILGYQLTVFNLPGDLTPGHCAPLAQNVTVQGAAFQKGQSSKIFNMSGHKWKNIYVTAH